MKRGGGSARGIRRPRLAGVLGPTGLGLLAGCRAQPPDPSEAPPGGRRSPGVERHRAATEIELDPEHGIRGEVEGSVLQLGLDTGQSFPLLLSRRMADRFEWTSVHAVEVRDGSGLNSQHLDVVPDQSNTTALRYAGPSNSSFPYRM